MHGRCETLLPGRVTRQATATDIRYLTGIRNRGVLHEKIMCMFACVRKIQCLSERERAAVRLVAHVNRLL